MEKWIEKSKKYWITIKDIEKLKPNTKIKLLVLDRNVYDCKDKFKRGQLYIPEKFMTDNSAVYWKNNVASLKGYIIHKWQEKEDDIVPFDIEFDIQYDKKNWYPLTNGILPAEDEQGYFKLLGVAKSWSEFPKATHIGWRGLMILWSNLTKLKKIYRL